MHIYVGYYQSYKFFDSINRDVIRMATFKPEVNATSIYACDFSCILLACSCCLFFNMEK